MVSVLLSCGGWACPDVRDAVSGKAGPGAGVDAWEGPGPEGQGVLADPELMPLDCSPPHPGAKGKEVPLKRDAQSTDAGSSGVWRMPGSLLRCVQGCLIAPGRVPCRDRCCRLGYFGGSGEGFLVCPWCGCACGVCLGGRGVSRLERACGDSLEWLFSRFFVP